MAKETDNIGSTVRLLLVEIVRLYFVELADGDMMSETSRPVSSTSVTATDNNGGVSASSWPHNAGQKKSKMQLASVIVFKKLIVLPY
jgi:hypothetical protein